MHETTCVVIGGGQSGLAMSRCLTDLGLDHVVLERGRVGRTVAQRALGLAAALSRRTGRAGCPASATTAPTPTAT